jgi:PAS domain S-box-containing protein
VTDPANDPARALEVLFDELFAEVPLSRTLEVGLQALVATASAETAGILVVDEGQVTQEHWYPADRGSLPAADALRLAVRDPLLASDVAGVAARAHVPPETVILPLEAHGVIAGAACFIPAFGTAPHGDLLRRVIRLLSFRVAAELELARGRNVQARYERWFKTLDEQLRLLDRERQKFAAMVHTSDAAVFVTDLERTIRWTNSVLSQRRPVGAAAWVGLSCHDVCRSLTRDPEQGRCADCPVDHALRENAVVHREFQSVQSGAGRSFYLTALPIKGTDGRPEEAMVMIQDLSDLEILRTSESRYRLLFERNGRGLVMVDPVTREVLLSNPSASAITGYAPDQLLTMQLDQLLPAEEWTRIAPIYQGAVEHGDFGAHDCRVLHREGWERVTTVSGTATHLDGRSVLMLEFRDVTETRKVEEALRRLEERLRVVVASSPIVLFALDHKGVFTLSEGRGLESLGLKPGQHVGQSVFEIYRDSPAVLAVIRRALSGEEFREEVDVGHLVYETSYSAIRGPDGSVQGVIGVATDVTQHRRLESQLRQVQRMESIGRLAGGVAHDFNNLLAAILGHSELMISRLDPGHPLLHSAEEIQKAAGRGAMLTRQLLAFGRKDMLTFQVLDLSSVVSGMDGMLRRLIGEDVDLVAVPCPRPAAVRADRSQMEQVILNLVVNARDAMPYGGKLTIEVGMTELDAAYAQSHPRVQPGPHVVLSVTDTGVGMDTEAITHVFEPFYTTKERGKGTGLGLATVYGIVEQAGGHVTVYSQPGIGSAFKVYLPCAEESEIRAEEPSPRAAPARGGSETILLAEDEDAVRSMTAEVLESLGYRVLIARDGLDALRVAEGHDGPIALLISDVVMPQMGGGELAERLTALRPDTRVMFVSGYPDDAIVRHGVLEKGSILLQKPFAIAEFVRKVREVLDAPAEPRTAAA